MLMLRNRWISRLAFSAFSELALFAAYDFFTRSTWDEQLKTGGDERTAVRGERLNRFDNGKNVLVYAKRCDFEASAKRRSHSKNLRCQMYALACIAMILNSRFTRFSARYKFRSIEIVTCAKPGTIGLVRIPLVPSRDWPLKHKMERERVQSGGRISCALSAVSAVHRNSGSELADGGCSYSSPH